MRKREINLGQNMEISMIRVSGKASPRFKRAFLSALGLVAAGGAALPATAHTSYMLPNVFTANLEELVTLQASFSDDLFRPEVVVDSDDYHVVLPDGSRTEFELIAPHRQLVILEGSIEQEGTYRFTTGVRRGRTNTRVLVDGVWKSLREFDGEAPPQDAELRTSQTETIADVYVTKKVPSRASVDQVIGRLVFQPVTHPNDIYLDGGFKFQVLFDGKPMQGQVINLYRSGGGYAEPKYHEEIEANEDGLVSLSFEEPGVYLVMTRHRAVAPAGAETDERSYTTSLTFDVQS